MFWASGLAFLFLWASTAAAPQPNRVDHYVAQVRDTSEPWAAMRWSETPRHGLVEYVFFGLADAALVVAALIYGSARLAGGVAGSLLLQDIAVRSIKVLVHKPRPPGSFASDLAFPSGHVADFTLPVLLFLFVVRPRITLGEDLPPADVTIAASLIGVYAGYRFLAGGHWVTDIAASLLLALAWALGTRRLAKTWVKNTKP